MKPVMRQLRDVVKPRVWSVGTPTTAPLAQDQQRCRFSEAFKLTNSLLHVGNGLMLNEFQRRLMKRATAAIADAVLGPTASPSLRLLLRRALRAAVAMASSAAFLLKMCGLAASLDHLDLAHDMKADVELASAVDSLLNGVSNNGPPAAAAAIPPTLLVRATLFTISVLTYWCDLSSTTESLTHLDSERLDLLTGVATALDLVFGGPALMENFRGLFKFGTAFGGRDGKHGTKLELDLGDLGDLADESCPAESER